MASTFSKPPFPDPLPLERLRVLPLVERKSLTSVEQILVAPDSEAPAVSEQQRTIIDDCTKAVIHAKERGASVMLIYGAHLLRNGAARILERMMANGWLTHLATNGAGTIHDWEYAWFGGSTESVEMGVAGGTFGTWDETATNIHLALMAGAQVGFGYGKSLGRFIETDGTILPSPDDL